MKIIFILSMMLISITSLAQILFYQDTGKTYYSVSYHERESIEHCYKTVWESNNDFNKTYVFMSDEVVCDSVDDMNAKTIKWHIKITGDTLSVLKELYNMAFYETGIDSKGRKYIRRRTF